MKNYSSGKTRSEVSVVFDIAVSTFVNGFQNWKVCMLVLNYHVYLLHRLNKEQANGGSNATLDKDGLSSSSSDKREEETEEESECFVCACICT